MSPRKFPYVKLHDLFAQHPKIRPLSDAAFRAQVTAICYSHALSSDGFYPVADAKQHPRKAVDELVRRGLWSPVDDGFQVHDYGQWNETKAEIEARANAKSIAGAIGAATRWGDSTTHVAGDNANASALAGSSSGRLRAKPRDEVYRPDFLAFWSAYPRKVGKRKAYAAWKDAMGRTGTATVILDGAERLRDDPNRTDEFTPHPVTWLNRDGWEDDPMPSRNGQSPHRLDQHYSRLREAAREG